MLPPLLGVNSFGVYNSRAADFGSGASHACPHEALYKILQRKRCVRNQNIFCAVCDRFSRWENKRFGENLGMKGLKQQSVFLFILFCLDFQTRQVKL